jgi:hypothetical protein
VDKLIIRAGESRLFGHKFARKGCQWTSGDREDDRSGTSVILATGGQFYETRTHI